VEALLAIAGRRMPIASVQALARDAKYN